MLARGQLQIKQAVLDIRCAVADAAPEGVCMQVDRTGVTLLRTKGVQSIRWFQAEAMTGQGKQLLWAAGGAAGDTAAITMQLNAAPSGWHRVP